MKNPICKKCNGKIVKTESSFSFASELGFSIKTRIYECQQCGEKYIICSNCDGYGYTNTLSPYKCSECGGHGLISIKNI